MKVDKTKLKRGGWVVLCVWCTLAALGSITFLLESIETANDLLSHKQDMLDIGLYLVLVGFSLKRIVKKQKSENSEFDA